jgi:hypothetical protein
VPFLAKLDLDARGSRRLVADRLDALLIGHDRRFDVIIHDMSQTGFLAEFSSELQVGDEVRLNLARIGFVTARVVRKRGLGHGCAFVEPVPLEVVEETIAASPGFGNRETGGGTRSNGKGARSAASIIVIGGVVAVAIVATLLAFHHFA